MISDKLILQNTKVAYLSSAQFGDIPEVMSKESERSKSMNFWKLAVAPQQGEIADYANELIRCYAQLTPGSDECSEFLLSLMHECRERIRNTLLPFDGREQCNIEFVTSMCRGLEIALSRIKGLSRIILSPYEHPSAEAVARWVAKMTNADVCKLNFEASDYLLSRSEQEKKVVELIQAELENSDGPTALILSVVSYSTGLVIRTNEIVGRLRDIDESSLHVILDGAHAAGNYISNIDIHKCWAYVISVHKWVMSPEPCGVIITPRKLSEDEICYDAWDRSFPVTTANARTITSLVSSLRFIDKVGLENWHAQSIRLRDYFIKRMEGRLSVIGYSEGIEMTSFIAVRPSLGNQWRWEKEELSKYLEQHLVYLLILSIDPETSWMRIAFPNTLKMQQVDELCDVLNTSLK